MAWCEWWITDDCCGVFCGFTTNLLLSYAAFVQTYFVLGPWWGYFHPITLCYLALTVMAALCHARTQFTNPGAVPLDNENLIDLENQNLMENSRTRRYCKTCQQYKPLEAHHCSTCHRCIIRMDHHCPWVNNCVAMFNQKYFLQFLLYTGCQCLFCLVSLSSRFFYCSKQPYPTDENGRIIRNADLMKHVFNGDDPMCNPSPIDVLLCVLNFIEGILFGLFTFIMLFDQLSAIFSNTPYIDQIKGKKGAKKQRYQCLVDVFGEPFAVSWFFPTPLTQQMKRNWMAMSNHYG
eukprot:CAMPEP_0197073360 /NCGR_PEP_ID=MMETSP1384-20130603/210568_1 /TAXON_ID=29189 /ORGANISM="Ammonia sp." /LENGTH=290 /DNA_ID=CAMNT_0042512197 /DNA_START=500 /DNA_END=1372 /DNA_ORIENTATION=-